MNITVGSPGRITELTYVRRCYITVKGCYIYTYIISHYLSRLTHMKGHGLYI